MDQTRAPTADELAKPVPRLIGHLHAFRGVTIVMIVAVHVGAILRFFNYDLDNGGLGIEITAFALEAGVHNATMFFAFISGLLFAQVLEPRGWKRFFGSKLRNVALPYLVVSAGYTLFALALLDGGYIEPFSGSLRDYLDRYIESVFHLEVQSNPILWYLPVLLILFALTPLIVPLLRSRAGPIAMAILLLLPLYFSRTWPLFSWDNVVFFLAPYAAGLFFGTPTRYGPTLDFARRHVFGFVAVFLAASVAIWFVLAQETQPVLWHGTDLFESSSYIQKMAAIPLLLLALRPFDRQVPRFLSRLADDSFAIYFLHIWPVVGLLWLVDTYWGALSSPLLYLALTIAGTVAICAMLVVIIGVLRRLLGKWSRPLIGA